MGWIVYCVCVCTDHIEDHYVDFMQWKSEAIFRTWGHFGLVLTTSECCLSVKRFDLESLEPCISLGQDKRLRNSLCPYKTEIQLRVCVCVRSLPCRFAPLTMLGWGTAHVWRIRVWEILAESISWAEKADKQGRKFDFSLYFQSISPWWR